MGKSKLENYVSLARKVSKTGWTPVFFLGPQELDWEKVISAQIPSAIFPLQSNNIGEEHDFIPQLTIALAERCRLSVSNDSGVGHMLAAGGNPLISLFGRTRPEKFMPLSTKVTIIKAQDYGGNELHYIPVEAVYDAVERVLS